MSDVLLPSPPLDRDDPGATISTTRPEREIPFRVPGFLGAVRISGIPPRTHRERRAVPARPPLRLRHYFPWCHPIRPSSGQTLGGGAVRARSVTRRIRVR